MLLHQARLHHVGRHHSRHSTPRWKLVHILHSSWRWILGHWHACGWWILSHGHPCWWRILGHGHTYCCTCWRKLIHELRSCSYTTRYWRTWWRILLWPSRNSLTLTISNIISINTRLLFTLFFSHLNLILKIWICFIICTIRPNNHTSWCTLSRCEIICRCSHIIRLLSFRHELSLLLLLNCHHTISQSTSRHSLEYTGSRCTLVNQRLTSHDCINTTSHATCTKTSSVGTDLATSDGGK